MTIDEAIKQTENVISLSRMAVGDVFQANNDYWETVLNTLREKRDAEKNEPITKEEIEKMNREPVFFVPLKNKDAIHGWSIIHDGSITSRSEAKPALMYFFYLKNYGTDWIAYRHKKGPSHE